MRKFNGALSDFINDNLDDLILETLQDAIKFNQGDKDLQDALEKVINYYSPERS